MTASTVLAGAAALPLLGASAATTAGTTSAAAVSDDHHPSAMGLLFSDEFDGTALDRGRWCTRYQYGGGAALQSGYQDAACGQNGAGTLDFLNDEKQRYRDVNSKGEKLHVVKDGVLSLTASKTGTGGAPYEAAMIRSKLELRPDGKTSYYLTSRVKLPSVKGSWPAFWLAPGMRNGASQWPPELDIFEGALNENGDDANMLHMASHGTKASGGATFNASTFDTQWGNLKQPGSIRDQWHEVGFEWTATSSCWFFDGTKMHCEKFSWVDDNGASANPSPILLNLAVGGNWAGRNGIDDARLPMSFDVDHVRVYSSTVTPGQQPSTAAPATTVPSTAGPSTPTPSTTAPSVPAGGSGTPGTGGNAAGALLRSNASGLCLTPRAVGTAATIQPCANQRWTTTSAGELKADGRCLAALGRRLRDGTPVGLQACNGSAAQRWTAKSDGSWTNAASGRCLDVEGQKTAAGTTLQLWTFKSQANQKWTSVGGGTPAPSTSSTR